MGSFIALCPKISDSRDVNKYGLQSNSQYFRLFLAKFFLGILGISDIELDEYQESSSTSKRFKKRYHCISPFTAADLQLGWSIECSRGVGLINTDKSKRCLNICYINSVLQCLAYAPTFAQWLSNDCFHDRCKSPIKLFKLKLIKVVIL